MDEQRLQEMQGRMIRSKRGMGIAMIVMSPVFYFLAPAGNIIAPAIGVFGIFSIVSSIKQGRELARKRSSSPSPPSPSPSPSP
jgi:hypothetical protein